MNLYLHPLRWLRSLPQYLLSCVPHTRRQWASAIVGTTAILVAVQQTAYFYYQQKRAEDVAAQERELQELRDRELRFWTSMATQSPSAIVAVDCETGRVTGWNPAATRILGWTPQDVVDREFLFLVPEEYLTEKYFSAQHYLATVTDPTVYKRPSVTAVRNAFVNTSSGRRVQCHVSIRSIGGPKYFYVVTIDPLDQVEVVDPPS